MSASYQLQARPANRQGKWTGSSKARPCPLCHRNTSDQCRRGPGWISCWHGTSFHPPDLKVGEVLTVEGEPWAVVSVRGGFGGNSTVLRPHEERQHLPRAARRKIERSEAQIVAGKIPVLLPLIEQALAVPPFEQLLDSEFQQARQLIVLALQEAAGMLPRLAAVAKGDAALERFLCWLQGKHRELQYQAADAHRWATDWNYRLATYRSGSPVLPEEEPEPPPPDLPPYQPRDLIVLALQQAHRAQGLRP
jgi:hypothetical protein